MSLFRVEDISCGHCEKAIKEVLIKEDPEIFVEVNLKDKVVKVEKLSDDRVLFLLKEVGYTPKKIKEA